MQSTSATKFAAIEVVIKELAELQRNARFSCDVGLSR